jgi:hypothetical protein
VTSSYDGSSCLCIAFGDLHGLFRPNAVLRRCSQQVSPGRVFFGFLAGFYIRGIARAIGRVGAAD